VAAFVAARLESRPGPLHRPAPSWRQSSAIEILARIPCQESLSHGPPFLSGKRPRSHGEEQSSYRTACAARATGLTLARSAVVASSVEAERLVVSGFTGQAGREGAARAGGANNPTYTVGRHD
jgi:hypothetical protein